MAAPLIVRLVMDAAGYLKTVDTAVASNTKLEESSLGVGEAMQVSATKSVQASLRATESLQTQVAAYRELAASASESAAVRERAALLANRAEGRLNAQTGAAATLAATSKAAQTGERDLGKFTRGALAGSGAASSLGRSLAFASTGFIAIAGGSTLIASSIKAALDLAKTQRQVDTQLQTGGKSWEQYGARIEAADLKLSHLSGFTNQELLQGFGYLVRGNNNVGESLKLTAEAADVARGRNLSLASAAIALAKAQGGSVTALRRLGIIVPKGVSGLQALAFVQEKFAGQAEAGATVSDRFHASLVNTEEIIGAGLLPSFTRLSTEIGDWLAKMNETGRLQRDVNEAVTVGGVVFHTLGDIIGLVDKVTGGFGNTLKIVLGAYAFTKVAALGDALTGLALKWELVGVAATEAGAAQTAALTEGTAGAAAGGRFAGLGASSLAPLSIPAVLLITDTKVTSNAKRELHDFIHGSVGDGVQAGLRSGLAAAKRLGIFKNDTLRTPFGTLNLAPFLRLFGGGPSGPGSPAFSAAQQRGQFAFPDLPSQTPGGRPSPPPFGGQRTLFPVFKTYTQTITEQIGAARAALTKTTRDDVANARRVIARIKRLIDRGQLSGAALVQALQDEASQQGVLDNARQAAAAQAAKIAAAKKAAASSYETPIDIQLAQARAELTATPRDDIAAAKAAVAAAKRALASGRKNKQGQLAALQAEAQAQQTLASLRQQSATSFTLPARLQLALAKAQATGADQTGILRRMKAALEKALKSARGNIQKQIDIYNQITSVNQQLGSSATSALGGFKQASTRMLTANLGLTAAQRKLLRARLSQLGPGGTVPGSGVGAAGYIIGKDGRPLVVHTHVNIDGKRVADNTTRHQQRRRNRNPSQRRGPHAGG